MLWITIFQPPPTSTLGRIIGVILLSIYFATTLIIIFISLIVVPIIIFIIPSMNLFILLILIC